MRRRRIGIVEDDYIVGHQIQLMLEEMGYDPWEPEPSGEGALLRMADEPCDLILMDVQLAGKLTGFQVAEHIRLNFRTPVIFISANGDAENVKRAKESQPYAYLIKPCSYKELQATVEIALMRNEIANADQNAKRVWQATFDAVPDLVFTVDDNFMIQRVNRSMAERLGADPEELIGRPCHQVIHHCNHLPTECPHSTAVALKKECRLERWEDILDGYFITTISPILDNTGQIIGWIHVCRDITERRQIEEERELLVCDLEHALGEVKTLSGMLPICSNCKNIRDDKGYWKQIEEYLVHHSDASFSHGICPHCMNKLYPELCEEEN